MEPERPVQSISRKPSATPVQLRCTARARRPSSGAACQGRRDSRSTRIRAACREGRQAERKSQDRARNARGTQSVDERTESQSLRYVAPDWFTRNVFNRIVAALTRLGISVWGSRVLEVRGRKSGEPRRTAVNLLTIEALDILSRRAVIRKGSEPARQWVRSLRVAGEGVLLLGPQRERFIGPDRRQ
jgi:hypothetical protein